jgi:hypothetical protein
MQLVPLCGILPPSSMVQAGRKMARPQLTQADCSLAGIAIFSGLPEKTLERLQLQCRWRRYQTGEAIVGYLDSSDDVFFIISGEVRVTIYSLAGKVVSFRELGPGEVFGEYPAIDRGPRSARRRGAHELPRGQFARRRVQGPNSVRARGGAGNAAAARYEDSGVDDARL